MILLDALRRLLVRLQGFPNKSYERVLMTIVVAPQLAVVAVWFAREAFLGRDMAFLV